MQGFKRISKIGFGRIRGFFAVLSTTDCRSDNFAGFMLIFCEFMPAHTDSCLLSDEKTQKSFKSGLFSKSYSF